VSGTETQGGDAGLGADGGRRVLVLAYFFPPMAVSGAVRPAAFCAHLGRFGYTPHVLTTTVADAHPPVAEDTTLCRLLPSDLRVERVPYFHWRRDLLALRRRLSRARPAAAVSAGATAPGRPPAAAAPRPAGGRLGDWVNRVFLFPDQQQEWAAAVRRRVRRLPAASRPDVVFATGSPWSVLLGGVDVARSLGVPLVADFRDPWARNLKPSFGPRLERLACRLERRVLASATRVVANTEALRSYFCSVLPERPEKFVTINNGISDALDAGAGEDSAAAQASDEGIELAYFGSISRQRVPRTLLTTIDELAREGRLPPGALQVSFTGPWTALPAEVEALVARLEAAGYVRRHAPVPYEECIRRMRRSQHLLILQQGFPMQIPAKIFEYMAVGRPMVLIGGEGATAELLESRRLGVACPDRAEAIKALVMRLVARELVIPAPSPAVVEEFHYRNLTRRLAQVFDEAILEHRQA